MKRFASLVVLASVACATATVRAQSDAAAEVEANASGVEASAGASTDVAYDPRDPSLARPVVGFAALDRPTGIAEAGFGWLTLPGAAVCIARSEGCTNGDTSFELDLWQIIRTSRRLAFGAGILLALIPTADAPEAQPMVPVGSETVERQHTRRYFTVEGMARYYPYVGQNVEWWLGITGGLVVVSDRFTVDDPGPERPLLGPNGVTIRTEGGSIGVAGGPVIALAQNWALGGTLRYGQWFLPHRPAQDAFGSEASLTGRVTVLSLGFNVAFRMPL